MIRTIIETDNENYVLHLPKEYLNRKLEVLILPFDENISLDKKLSGNIIDESKGIFAGRNIDPLKWQKEIRNEWD